MQGCVAVQDLSTAWRGRRPVPIRIAALAQEPDTRPEGTGILGELIAWKAGVDGKPKPVMALPSNWVALLAVATKLGTTAETPRKRVRQAERETGLRPGLTTRAGAAGRLERENREPRRTPNEILKTASAFFALAALDRRTK